MRENKEAQTQKIFEVYIKSANENKKDNERHLTPLAQNACRRERLRTCADMNNSLLVLPYKHRTNTSPYNTVLNDKTSPGLLRPDNIQAKILAWILACWMKMDQDKLLNHERWDVAIFCRVRAMLVYISGGMGALQSYDSSATCRLC